MPTKRTRATRSAAQLAIALLVAVAAGTAFVLGAVAVLGFTWDPRGSFVIALAAIWIPQTLLIAARHGRN